MQEVAGVLLGPTHQGLGLRNRINGDLLPRCIPRSMDRCCQTAIFKPRLQLNVQGR
jgi:hypothetical protein